MNRRTSRSGATLLELMVAIGVLTLILSGLFAALFSAQSAAATGGRIADNNEAAARLAQGLQLDLEETGIESVDTAFRFRDAASPSATWLENHFHDSSAAIRQCTSAACAWHTYPSPIGTVQARPERIVLSRNLHRDSTGTSVLGSGRPWLALRSPLCPLDGSFAASGADLDAMMLFTPREPGGAFVAGEATAREIEEKLETRPDWQGIVLYFPWYDPAAEDLQLRRLVVYRQDLLAGTGNSTGGWNAWDGNSPSGVPALVDLLDFGTDGTLDGVPDGGIPLVPETSDAALDSFESYGQWLVRYKWIQTARWYRYFYLQIDRSTGDVYWFVFFEEDPDGDEVFEGGPSWHRTASFVRAPEVVAHHVVDLDFSTASSNPASLVNPHGLSNPQTVRVAIAMERRQDVGGEVRNVEHVLDFEVKPRNSQPPDYND